MTRDEAIAAGEMKYHGAKPCKRGHWPCLRFVSSNSCVACMEIVGAQRYAAKSAEILRVAAEYREVNREKINAQKREHYHANKDEILSGQKEYHAKRGKDLARARRQANPEKVKAEKKAWAAANPEAYRAMKKRDYEKNKRKRLAQMKAHRDANKELVKARRKAHIRRATPKWVDKAAIAAIYEQAARVSAETGVMHHVDHIIPIRGKGVWGLHVPWNLQILPARDNIRKGNRLLPELAEAA